jgi:2-dehydropantoate 2-reductase
LIVGLIGPGALGTLVGAALAPRASVRVLTRDPRTAREIASRGGLVVDDRAPQRVTVSADPGVLAGCEAIVVAVKAYDTVAALAACRGTAFARTPFIAFQNGLESVAQIEYALARHGGIALAATTEAAIRTAPGTVVRHGHGMTRTGWAAGHRGEDGILRSFVRALEGGLEMQLVDPVEPYVWAKLVANAAINPLTALAGVRNGELLERVDLRERAARIAREAAAVARGEGIALPFEDPVSFVEGVALATAGNRSSMLEDLAAGRRTEIEEINGAVVRRAARHGVPVPENLRALDEVRARRKA